MTELWRGRYRSPGVPEDVVEELLRSGMLDPYDKVYPILQGNVLVLWPMNLWPKQEVSDAPKDA